MLDGLRSLIVNLDLILPQSRRKVYAFEINSWKAAVCNSHQSNRLEIKSLSISSYVAVSNANPDQKTDPQWKIVLLWSCYE